MVIHALGMLQSHDQKLLRACSLAWAHQLPEVNFRYIEREMVLTQRAEKGFADREGWRDEIPPMQEINTTFLLLSTLP